MLSSDFAGTTEDSSLMVAASIDDGASSTRSESSAVLLEEMDQPWPATYERSISLLASPIINAVRVNLSTWNVLLIMCGIHSCLTCILHFAAQ